MADTPTGIQVPGATLRESSYSDKYEFNGYGVAIYDYGKQLTVYIKPGDDVSKAAADVWRAFYPHFPKVWSVDIVKHSARWREGIDDIMGWHSSDRTTKYSVIYAQFLRLDRAGRVGAFTLDGRKLTPEQFEQQKGAAQAIVIENDRIEREERERLKAEKLAELRRPHREAIDGMTIDELKAVLNRLLTNAGDDHAIDYYGRVIRMED